MATWITDANNNRCSAEYWGSSEAAQVALDSLRYCSDCSRCSRCSDCSRCSGCSDLMKAAPAEGSTETIAVPVIPDIHKVVYAAASNPDALRMDTWHTCEKKHCR